MGQESENNDHRGTDAAARQRVTLLGSTGSIGDSTLDVIGRHPHRFEVFALSGRTRLEKLLDQCVRFRPAFAVVDDEASARWLVERLRLHDVATDVLAGADSLAFIAGHESVDVVVTGIVGAAGLLPTLAAVEAPRRVLIANKEPLVMMGEWILRRARENQATVIPLDSEHNAIFQCLPEGFIGGGMHGGVRRLLLTASGGPFRTFGHDRLRSVTLAEAVAHPNWVMGPKISVDSATLMNKGLEIIEACALFAIASQDVGVVIHPQSTIHSMVEYIDGSVIAQMGAADMRVPIAHGLGWPGRIESGATPLDFYSMSHLEFERPDETRFPCLRLAREAATSGGVAPIVLNAANEIAVAAFLADELSFTAIAEVIEHTLGHVAVPYDASLDGVLQVDHEARVVALAYLKTRFGAVVRRN